VSETLCLPFGQKFLLLSAKDRKKDRSAKGMTGQDLQRECQAQVLTFDGGQDQRSEEARALDLMTGNVGQLAPSHRL
jgi:hypothetical protein